MKQLDRRQVETMGWPILEPIQAEGVPRPIALSKEVCIAGARETVNLKLSSPLISRTHAIFVADRDSIYLRDLASRNHTYLNDEPIREAILRNGDVIGLGPMTFRCQSGFDRPYEPDEFNAPSGELRLESDDTRFPLNGRTALIGSRRDCDILLPGDDVDPAHAVIYQREGRRFIRDLRSHSYTLVNNEQVKDAELQPGDRIQIGDFHLIYQTESAPVETQIPFELHESATLEDTHAIPLSLDEPPQESSASPKVADELESGSIGFKLDESPADEHGDPPAPPEQPEENAIPLAEDTEPPQEEISFEPAEDEEENLDLLPAAELLSPIDEAGHEPAPTAEQEIPTFPPNESNDPESEHESHSAGQERLTELLGELVETVEKVQSTWEEVKRGAA